MTLAGGDLWRRVCVTVAALLMYRLAAQIPLIGVDRQALGIAFGGGSADAAERTSLAALGVIPIFSAVAIGELARLLGPARWSAAWHSGTVPDWILWLALAFAAMQGGGIAMALEEAGAARLPLVAEPGTQFRAVTVVAVVTATALFWWLAHVITRRGLGSGLWWLFLTPFLLEQARTAQGVAELLRTGAMTGSDVLMLPGYAVLAMFVIVLLYRLVVNQRGEPVLWPALLAPVALNVLLWPLAATAIVSSRDLLTEVSAWLAPGRAAWLIVSAILIWALVALRTWRDAEPPARWQAGVLTLGIIAVMAIANLIDAGSPYPVLLANAPYLIAIAVVMSRLLDDVGFRNT